MQSFASSHHASSPLARRISIVGPTGSGKSVLARTLAEQHQLPLIELDQYRQAQVSSPDPDAEFVRAVSAITADPAWIVDGHYRMVREEIWRRAEMIIWLNYSFGFVLMRLAGRFAARPRAASPTESTVEGPGARLGSTPRASWSRRFGRLTRTVRERREYRQLLTEAARWGTTVVELRSDAETRAWLRSMDPRQCDKDSDPEGRPSC